jgi:hypothetical protein
LTARRRLLAAALALCAALPPAGARATQTAAISAAFTPEKLGAPTTISLGFEVHAPGGGVPSPLTGVDLRYPANLGLATSGLGLAVCSAGVLEEHGPSRCPANSWMGRGSALARFQIGAKIFQESATLALVAGPSREGYVNLLVAATGLSPVAARIVISAALLPGRLRFGVPLVPSLPGGPDVAVVRVRATIGGDLAYYERAHGRRVRYRPQGVKLPRSCPRGGFRFHADFSFLDGSQAQAQTVVRCPGRHG